MIKALFLIFIPVPTWEQIAAFQRKTSTVLLTYLLPMLLISTVAECYGLVHWGKPRGDVNRVSTFTVSEAVVYGAGRILLSIAIVVIMAKMIKALGETFHGRHSFHQVFMLASYGLSPLFLLRVLNIFPAVSIWATWAVGAILCAVILYHGLPVVMRPDPSHAFGLYLMTVLLLFFVTGLTCFLTFWYVRGHFAKLDDLVSQIASHLPF
ncbi:MAG TPA: Yip1 family protein [Candidatus Paceibacterota bacterium]|nr:Yip1 family protein [Candidatus Paceibacterota bacterium]